jgi:hypothetical protein
MRYSELNRALIEQLPELEPQYRHETRAGDEGPHVVYGDVLYPFVERLLRKANRTSGEDDALRRAFALVEHLASDAEPLVQGVADIEFAETLRGSPDLLELSRPFLGPRTLELIESHI